MALWSARAHETGIGGQERIAVGLFAVAINAYALVALSAEFWDYFGKTSAGIEATLAQHLALSVLWTAYAGALLFVGIQKTSGLLRWQSLALFGLTVGKVFLYDLGFLDRGYRIFSFLAQCCLPFRSFISAGWLAKKATHDSSAISSGAGRRFGDMARIGCGLA